MLVDLLQTDKHLQPCRWFFPCRPHTFRGIAMAEIIRALRNSDSRTKFQRVQCQILYRFRCRGYPVAALWAIMEFDFSQRTSYLETPTNERPLPLNNLYYQFFTPLNAILHCMREGTQVDHFLWTTLPTPLFLACKNHLCIGQTLSHKWKDFNTLPGQPNFHWRTSIAFEHQKFNRPRRKEDLDKSCPPAMLRRTDRTCGNSRCLVCPLLHCQNYVPPTTN